MDTHFYGVITNTSTDTDPADAVYLNGDSFNLTLSAASYGMADNFGNTPLLLAGGESSGDIDLFDITLNDPATDPFGPYTGTYGLIGGQDGGDFSGQDNLAQADFFVDVVAAAAAPEPATLPLLLIGLSLIGYFGRGCRRKRKNLNANGRHQRLSHIFCTKDCSS